MLKGPRITLRHMAESDLPLFAAIRADPGAHGEHTQTDATSPTVVRKKFLETGYSTANSEVLLICDENDVVIGHVAHFTERAYSSARELGWLLYEDEARGKGYATEAVSLLINYLFSSFPINRVECVTSPENLKSVELAKRVGLTFEGTLRQLVFVRGKYADGAVFSMLRSEWQERQGSASAT